VRSVSSLLSPAPDFRRLTRSSFNDACKHSKFQIGRKRIQTPHAMDSMSDKFMSLPRVSHQPYRWINFIKNHQDLANHSSRSSFEMESDDHERVRYRKTESIRVGKLGASTNESAQAPRSPRVFVRNFWEAISEPLA
jgi:hypothetical protein